MIDIHNHVLVDIDDGPENQEESIDLLRQAAGQGITDIIATPHQIKKVYESSKLLINDRVESLNQIIAEMNIDIKIHPGQEIRLTNNIASEINNGNNISLNNGKYILVEFPFEEVPENFEVVFDELLDSGYIPILAHPERCIPLREDMNRIKQISDMGVMTQLTAASILGEFGKNAQKASFELIENNLVYIIGSDAHHSERRPFLLNDSYKIIDKKYDIYTKERFMYNSASILGI